MATIGDRMRDMAESARMLVSREARENARIRDEKIGAPGSNRSREAIAARAKAIAQGRSIPDADLYDQRGRPKSFTPAQHAAADRAERMWSQAAPGRGGKPSPGMVAAMRDQSEA